MKKTQKVLDSIKYIDNKDLNSLELERLIDELETMLDLKQEGDVN